MSMNILIKATRQIQVIKTGRIEEQSIRFPAWQTPTQVTMEILKSVVPTDAYRAWVMSTSEDYTVAVFAEDDIWEDGEPIGTKTCNDGKIQAEVFDLWLKMCDEEGFEVSYGLI